MPTHNQVFVEGANSGRWYNTGLVVPSQAIFNLAVVIVGLSDHPEELPLIVLSSDRLKSYVNTGDFEDHGSISLFYRIGEFWDSNFSFSVRDVAGEDIIMFKSTNPGIYDFILVGIEEVVEEDDAARFTIGGEHEWVGTGLMIPDEDRFDLDMSYTDGATYNVPRANLRRRRLRESRRVSDGDDYRSHHNVVDIPYHGDEVSNADLHFTLDDDGQELMFYTPIQGDWVLEIVE